MGPIIPAEKIKHVKLLLKLRVLYKSKGIIDLVLALEMVGKESVLPLIEQ